MGCFFSRGKIVLGYTEAELRVRGSGYQFIHAADMLYCAENHVRSELCRLIQLRNVSLDLCTDVMRSQTESQSTKGHHK